MTIDIATDWYFSVHEGESRGPVSLQSLQNAVRNGHLRPHHFVWHESLGAWMKAGSVELLKVALPPPVAIVTSPQTTRRAQSIVQDIQTGPWAELTEMGRTGTLVKVMVGIYAVLFVLLAFSSIASLLGITESERQTDFGGLFMQTVVGPLLLVIMFGIYALPSGLAYVREHRNAVPIMIINLAFGWTFLGWIAALAWAFTADVVTTEQTVRIVRVKADNDAVA